MNERQALRKLHKWAQLLTQTSPVDDYFPEVIHNFHGAVRAANKAVDDTPKIVCLCGSTRFKEAFDAANKAETIGGNIVLSVGCFPHSDMAGSPEQMLGKATKIALDELHKRKIDMADEVLVLNVDGYIGDSTRSEVEYARAIGKPIRWLEPDKSV